MNLFRLNDWWKYWRAAKGRHGVHSPFVYGLIDKGLRKPLPKSVRKKLRSESKSSYQYRQRSTSHRVTSFLESVGYNNCISLEGPAEAIVHAFAEKAVLPEKGAYFLIKDIHASPEHVAMWKALSADQSMNLSIDLWYIGLLFYRPDFKEKQHFILKHQS